MTVAELLTLMGHLSVGNDNVSALERAIFLQYLNLAHCELYQGTASLNQDLWQLETLTTEERETTVLLAHPPYRLQQVYDRTHHRPLSPLSFADLLHKDPEFKDRGSPQHYSLQGQTLRFYPAPSAVLSVQVALVPQPVLLKENTLEEEIPYPLAYHPVLVDGALTYLFQEEGGFKNPQKAQAAEQRWEIGKTRLISYLYQASGSTFSTFSSV